MSESKTKYWIGRIYELKSPSDAKRRVYVGKTFLTLAQRKSTHKRDTVTTAEAIKNECTDWDLFLVAEHKLSASSKLEAARMLSVLEQTHMDWLKARGTTIVNRNAADGNSSDAFKQSHHQYNKSPDGKARHKRHQDKRNERNRIHRAMLRAVEQHRQAEEKAEIESDKKKHDEDLEAAMASINEVD